MQLLIADDCRDIHATLKGLLETFGHTFIHAHNGQEAIEAFEKHPVDLVLMDLIMPITDGITATREIKARCVDKHIPILIVSAVVDSITLSLCMEAGADGLLPKPVDGFLLNAKIKAHERINTLTDQLQATNKRLESAHFKTSKDLHLARTVLEKAEEACCEFPPNITWHTRATEQFNGDLVLGVKSPSGGHYILVADFTGHGLPAALGAMPVSQIFRTLAHQNIPVNQIAEEINTCLYRYLPDNMFATAVIGEVNPSASRFTYWSGGFPDMMVFKDQTLAYQVSSKHMPLGVLDIDEFSSVTDVITLNDNERLLIFTDGLIELPDHTGRQFDYRGLAAAIGPHTKNWIKSIFDAADSYYGQPDVPDDLTLMEISPVEHHLEVPLPASSELRACEANAGYTPWSLNFFADAHQLKQDNVLAEITKILGGFPELAERLPELSCVVAEAYNNCVDHGLLDLNSHMKMVSTITTPEQMFLQYYQMRQERLANFVAGSIELEFSTKVINNRLELLIKITDSGDGFDYHSALATLVEDIDHDKPCHRGLALIHQLCENIRFADGGRTMLLTFIP